MSDTPRFYDLEAAYDRLACELQKARAENERLSARVARLTEALRLSEGHRMRTPNCICQFCKERKALQE